MTAATKLRRAALIVERNRVLAVEGDPADPRFPSAFLATYLGHYARSPVTGFPISGATWHPDLQSLVFGGLGSGMALAVVAPRGYAKSTVCSLAVPLACLARELKSYIWLASDSSGQAKLLLAAVIRELDTPGSQLLRDFPRLRRAYDSRRRPVADRDDAVVLASGARIEAIGVGQKLRGRRQGERRPDLLIADDIESEASTHTRDQREKVDSWLSGAALPALGPKADVIVLGTPLHADSVIMRLQQREGWEGKRYPAMTTPGDYASSTWPELWPADRLEEARRRMGSLAFSREVLLNPVDESTQLFPRRHYRYADTRSRLLEAETGAISARVRIACDPAIGTGKGHDYTAIAVTATIGTSGEHHVLDVIRFRASGKQIAERVKAEYERWRRYSPVVLVEAVQAQAWMGQLLRDEGVPVVDVKPTKDKIIRWEPLAVLYEQGSVWHSPHLRGGDYEAELEVAPAGEHDDQIDAVQMAIAHAAARATLRIEVL